MYLLAFYVPASHKEAVKDALFHAGAGRIGNYDSCAWETEGQGQFRPLEGSKPYLGQEGSVHYEEEYKVELVVTENALLAVKQALLAAHPYETPAYHFVAVKV